MSAVLKPRACALARESIDQVMDEIRPLLRLHFMEISFYPDIPLDPDFGRYRRAESAGQLRIYTARSGHELVGYAIFAIDWAPHYKGSLQAIQDIMYVSPPHRGGRIGMKLIRHCERELQAEGVQVIRHHVKADHPELGTLLVHSGYRLEDLLYSKRLD